MTAAAVAWALVAAAAVYTAAARRRPWPPHRTACWYAGLAAIAAASALLGGDDTAHMTGHLLLGMVAPLLLVLAAPVTLALRALPVAAARRLTRVLKRTAPLTHPVVAGILDIGGLWLVYTTGLHAEPLVQLHVLAAGYLFTTSVVKVDPLPHRASPAVRAAALVAAAAAHGILAKHLWATDPDLRTGAMVMYYGGDAVEVALAVLLCREWLLPRRAGGPQHAEVEHHEQRADDRDGPHPADGRRRAERGRHDDQHQEGDPDAARHRSGDRAVGHGRHGAIPAQQARSRSSTSRNQSPVNEPNSGSGRSPRRNCSSDR